MWVVACMAAGTMPWLLYILGNCGRAMQSPGRAEEAFNRGLVVVMLI